MIRSARRRAALVLAGSALLPLALAAAEWKAAIREFGSRPYGIASTQDGTVW